MAIIAAQATTSGDNAFAKEQAKVKNNIQSKLHDRRQGGVLGEELRRREAARTAILYAFDLIELDGEDLRHLPYWDRKAPLARLLRDTHFATPAERATVSPLL